MNPCSDPPLVSVKLYGRLRERFGAEFKVSSSTPALALYGLMRIVPGFQQELNRGSYRLVRGDPKTGIVLRPNLVSFMLAGAALHIIPAAIGAAKGTAGGVIKIVLGVTLIALAAATGFGLIGTAGGLAGLGTLGGISALSLGFVGFGLVLGGIGSILSHLPKPPKPNASFLISPPGNTVGQGGCVPLFYGFKVRIGSVTISAGYQAIALVAGQYKTQGTTEDYPYDYNPIDNPVPPGVSGQRTGSVTAVTVVASGSGYTHATVTFNLPSGVSGSGAAAYATIGTVAGVAGCITGITVTAAGSDYAASPYVEITGDGTGAAAVATVAAD